MATESGSGTRDAGTYDLFRQRNPEYCECVWRRLRDAFACRKIGSKKEPLRVLSLGPGPGAADIIPLLKVAKSSEQARKPLYVDITWIDELKETGTEDPMCDARWRAAPLSERSESNPPATPPYSWLTEAGYQKALSESEESETYVTLTRQGPRFEDWLGDAETHAWANKKPFHIVAACQIFQHTPHARLLALAIRHVLDDKGLFVFDSFDSQLFDAIQGLSDRRRNARELADACLDFVTKKFDAYNKSRSQDVGVFWRPFFETSRPDYLKDFLTHRGFAPVAQKELVFESKSVLCRIRWEQLEQAVSDRSFGPLRWGAPIRTGDASTDDHQAYTDENETSAGCKAFKELNDALANKRRDPPSEPLCYTVRHTYHVLRADNRTDRFGTRIGMTAITHLQDNVRFTLSTLHDGNPATDLTKEYETQFENNLVGFIQILIASSLLPISTRLMLPFFGRLNDKNLFERIGNQFALVPTEHTGVAFTTLREHIEYWPCDLEPLTQYLMNQPARLRTTGNADDPIVFSCLPDNKGQNDADGQRVKPIDWGTRHLRLVRYDGTRNTMTNRRPPDCRVKRAFGSHLFCTYGLAGAGAGAGDKSFSDGDRALTEYAQALWRLRERHDVVLLPLIQFTKHTEGGGKEQRARGLGAIMLMLDHEVNKRVYGLDFTRGDEPQPSGWREANFHLFHAQLHAITALARNFALLAVLGQIQKDRVVRQTLIKRSDRIRSQIRESMASLAEVRKAFAEVDRRQNCRIERERRIAPHVLHLCSLFEHEGNDDDLDLGKLGKRIRSLLEKLSSCPIDSKHRNKLPKTLEGRIKALGKVPRAPDAVKEEFKKLKFQSKKDVLTQTSVLTFAVSLADPKYAPKNRIEAELCWEYDRELLRLVLLGATEWEDDETAHSKGD